MVDPPSSYQVLLSSCLLLCLVGRAEPSASSVDAAGAAGTDVRYDET